MKISNVLILLNSLSAKNFAKDRHTDKFPANIENVGKMFQTMEEHPVPVKLEFTGRVPSWLKGSFYRNGPGRYEFGNASMDHFFDPSAIAQRLEISNQELHYRYLKFVKSRYIPVPSRQK